MRYVLSLLLCLALSSSCSKDPSSDASVDAAIDIPRRKDTAPDVTTEDLARPPDLAHNDLSSREALPPPPNDKCENATPLTVTIGSTLSVAGTTLGASNDSGGYLFCVDATVDGPDVYYKFDYQKGVHYDITVIPQQMTYDLSIYLLWAACPADCFAGSDILEVGEENIGAWPNTNGTYYLVIDGRAAKDAGDFTIKINASKP
jgi:hypothetical protein